ncbi:hypothetical protein ACTFTM_26185 [Micromonospora sp. RB23]
MAVLIGFVSEPLFALTIFLLLPMFHILMNSGLYELRRLRRPDG